MFILCLIDSFKGTISSVELSNIITTELNKMNIKVDCFPISDGGEGFLDAVSYGILNKNYYVNTVGPLNRPIRTYYFYDGSTAYIELAKAAGINLLDDDELNPLYTSTYGVGLVIKNAINKGIKNIVVGIGGSCTNDGGSGILEALGVKFYDVDGNLLNFMNNEKLGRIDKVEMDEFKKNIEGFNFTVVSDVRNPLLGSNGATYIYSPQKGAKLDDLRILETNMNHYSCLIERQCNGDFRNIPGSGAAGGVGFALLSMFKAKMVNGIDYIFEKINFEEIYKDCISFVITGEGKIDKQSLYGKVVFEVAKRVKPVKVIALSAINELSEEELKENGIYKAYSIVGNITSKEKSMNRPKLYFKKLVSEINFYEL